MAVAADDMTSALRGQIAEAKSSREKAESDFEELELACIELLYKMVRITCPLNRAYQLTLWSRHKEVRHDPKGWSGAPGTWTGSVTGPLIGMVIDYEISDRLAVYLIIAPIEGDSEYRINPQERDIEIVDWPPDPE